MKLQSMKNSNYNNGIPEEVMQLIPWCAIGKLSVGDQAFFDKALLKYALLGSQLKQELQLIKTVSADKSLLGLSVISTQEERLKSVFNMIDIADSEEKATNNIKSGVNGSLLGKLKNAFDALIPKQGGMFHYARLASVGLLVLSIGFLTSLVAPSFTEKSHFIPASPTTPDSNEQTKTSLLVGFNGTSIQLSNNDVLKDKQIKVEAVPDKEGIYQISFEKLLSPEEIKQTLDALQKQQELVWFAGEAF